jgi:membrane fusion protein (multidrug efflux system)
MKTSQLNPLYLLVAIPLFAACANHEVPTVEHESKILVTRPVQREVSIARDYVCQIHSKRHIEVRALEQGYVKEVAVTEGQRVDEGQLMFEILPVVYQAELERAEAEATAAHVEYDNTMRLSSNKVVSPSHVALAKAKYQKAQADVELARAHLGFTKVKAPFGGIMDRLHVWGGSLVEEGDLLTTLSDNSVMWAYFNVPEAEYIDYVTDPSGAVGKTVELLMANGRVFAHPGTVAAIEANFNNTTGTIPFRADFPNPDGLLRHGQTGNILIKTRIPDALVIPQKATFEILDHTYVFVVGEDGVARQTRVGIREELEDLFVIDDSLAPAQRIVLEGQRHIRDGQKIDYEDEDPERVLAQLKVPAE